MHSSSKVQKEFLGASIFQHDSNYSNWWEHLLLRYFLVGFVKILNFIGHSGVVGGPGPLTLGQLPSADFRPLCTYRP